MEKSRIERLVEVLDTKVNAGLHDLAGIPINTEEYTVCLNNLLASMELLNKLTYKPNSNQNETK